MNTYRKKLKETSFNEGSKGTTMTLLLIIACCFFYPVGLHSDAYTCSYAHVFLFKKWWTVFTALFVHGNLMHLLTNMLFLFLFGRGLERHIGPVKLLAVFLLGGAVSMLLSILYYKNGVVGASGSICALLATLMLFNPWRFSFLLVFFPMPIGVAGFTYMLLNFAGFYADAVNRHSGGMQTAYVGHITGFIAGVFFGMLFFPDWKKNLFISIVQFIVFYGVLLVILHFWGR